MALGAQVPSFLSSSIADWFITTAMKMNADLSLGKCVLYSCHHFDSSIKATIHQIPNFKHDDLNDVFLMLKRFRTSSSMRIKKYFSSFFLPSTPSLTTGLEKACREKTSSRIDVPHSWWWRKSDDK